MITRSLLVKPQDAHLECLRDGLAQCRLVVEEVDVVGGLVEVEVGQVLHLKRERSQLQFQSKDY